MRHTKFPWGKYGHFVVAEYNKEKVIAACDNEDDAKFIACTPDLLEACDAILSFLEKGQATYPYSKIAEDLKTFFERTGLERHYD